MNDEQIDSAFFKDRKKRQQEESRKKIFRFNQGWLTKMMILSLTVVRCTSAKSIDGLSNEIKQTNPPGSYGINHDKNSGNDKVKIEEEVIHAFNCKDGGTASAKISLNPPPDKLYFETVPAA